MQTASDKDNSDDKIESDLELSARFFESRYGLVLATARRYAPNPDCAYDIAQQTFLIFIQKARENHWNPEDDPDPLLKGIVKKVALKFWEKEQKHRPEALRRINEHLRDLVARLEPPESSAKAEGSRIMALHDCLDKLSQKSREMLFRHYRDKTTLEDIAFVEQVNANTIRQFFCRLRYKLRECVERTLRNRQDEK